MSRPSTPRHDLRPGAPDLRAAIVAELARQGRTRTWLAGRIGVAPSNLSRALAAGHDPRLSLIEACCQALGLTLTRGPTSSRTP